MARRVRMGWPRRAPQVTPAPLAMTSEFDGAAKGEMLPASMRTPRRNMEKPALRPCRRSWNPITDRNERATQAQKCSTLSLMRKRPMSTITGEAAGDREPTTTVLDLGGNKVKALPRSEER